jgi:hypothetical protein
MLGRTSKPGRMLAEGGVEDSGAPLLGCYGPICLNRTYPE